jgi:hypothetical protein
MVMHYLIMPVLLLAWVVVAAMLSVSNYRLRKENADLRKNGSVKKSVVYQILADQLHLVLQALAQARREEGEQ